MSASREVKRRRREQWRSGTRRAVAALESRGVCWSEWAAERGFAPHAVKDVARDRNPATRGELFEVAARIRDEAAPLLQQEAAHLREVAERASPAPAVECRVCGKPSPETLELLADMAAKLAALQSGLDRLLACAGQEAAPPAEGKCRSCGCTNWAACQDWDGPCHWVEPDLCSACADPAGEPLEA